MKKQWIAVTERLPRSGQEVLAGWRESTNFFTDTGRTNANGEAEMEPDYFSQYVLVEYYRAGDTVIEEEPKRPGETPTQRLLRVLKQKPNRTIERDGFYLYQPGKNGLCVYQRHGDYITHWMELTEVPEEGAEK